MLINIMSVLLTLYHGSMTKRVIFFHKNITWLIVYVLSVPIIHFQKNLSECVSAHGGELFVNLNKEYICHGRTHVILLIV